MNLYSSFSRFWQAFEVSGITSLHWLMSSVPLASKYLSIKIKSICSNVILMKSLYQNTYCDLKIVFATC